MTATILQQDNLGNAVQMLICRMLTSMLSVNGDIKERFFAPFSFQACVVANLPITISHAAAFNINQDKR